MGNPKLKFSVVLLLTWGVFFVVLFARMISLREDGLFLGHENLWSDWALHISLAKTFAEKSPGDWFAYHPVFADGKLTYAFLTNLISGLLMRAGLSLQLAFIIPSIITALALIEGMHQLIRVLLRSSTEALLAISLFFLSSGLGFLDYLRDLFHGVILPAKQYSRIDSYGWLSGNYIVGQLLPQRAFLLGMAIAIWALVGLFHVLLKEIPEARRGSEPESKPISKNDKCLLILSGLAAGLLPIAHMHSLIALLLIMLPVFALTVRRWRAWAWFGVPATALSSVLFFSFIHGGIKTPHFMNFQPGYLAHGWLDWVSFWFRAWGLTIPLACVALVLLFKFKRKEVSFFFSGFFLLFIFANLVLTQPTAWDNTKHFLWCYFGFSVLTAHLLLVLWRKRRILKPVVVVATIVLAFTGVLELILLQRVSQHTHQLLNGEEIRLADLLRERTGPLDRFLTAPDHNHPVAVWAVRPVLLGYAGWAWNYGFNYGQTESDIRTMYQGGEQAVQLLSRHRVSYVYIGPREIGTFHPNEQFFRESFPLAFESPESRVFDTRRLISDPK